MSQFYQVDSAKVSLREYWWSTRSPLVIIGWILKWLRVRIPSSTDDANTESTLSFITPELPADIEAMFTPLTQELAQLGFCDPVFHVIYDAGSSTTLYWATLRWAIRCCGEGRPRKRTSTSETRWQLWQVIRPMPWCPTLMGWPPEG